MILSKENKTEFHMVEKKPENILTVMVLMHSFVSGLFPVHLVNPRLGCRTMPCSVRY